MFDGGALTFQVALVAAEQYEQRSALSHGVHDHFSRIQATRTGGRRHVVVGPRLVSELLVHEVDVLVVRHEASGIRILWQDWFFTEHALAECRILQTCLAFRQG